MGSRVTSGSAAHVRRTLQVVLVLVAAVGLSSGCVLTKAQAAKATVLLGARVEAAAAQVYADLIVPKVHAIAKKALDDGQPARGLAELDALEKQIAPLRAALVGLRDVLNQANKSIDLFTQQLGTIDQVAAVVATVDRALHLVLDRFTAAGFPVPL
jgi:hypothetical protein